MKKKIITVIAIFAFAAIICMITLTGRSFLRSKVQSLQGSITGNTYLCEFYSNSGEKFMTMEGTNIDMESNIIRERIYSDGSWGYTKTLSSVITITIDGSQTISCGSSILFIEKDLTPDVDFKMKNIQSRAEGFGDYTFIANIVNKYKNDFGKPMVCVIQSQLGDPICAFSGEEVYWEVCEDLPKTTKLMIDGKALYIHRANFEIIDKDLLVDMRD